MVVISNKGSVSLALDLSIAFSFLQQVFILEETLAPPDHVLSTTKLRIKLLIIETSSLQVHVSVINHL